MTAWLAKDEEKNNSSSSSTSEIKHANNKVYFYSDVSSKSVLKFQEALDNATENVLSYARKNKIEPAPVYIHINSYGGSLFSGLAAFDIIERCEAPTVSVVEGCAASAATIMSVAALTRLITPHSFMLIHQLSSFVWGTYENIKDGAENAERWMEMIRSIYLSKTKLKRRKLNELLKRDLFFPPEDCLGFGLVDGIYRG